MPTQSAPLSRQTQQQSGSGSGISARKIEQLKDQRRNPVNRALIAGYRPVPDIVLRHPKAALAVANVSVASIVGFIALAGVAAKFAVIMLLYLRHAWEDRMKHGKTTLDDLLDVICKGAVLRVRPKAMTVAVIVTGLLLLFWGNGTGSEVMQRIAAPMIGGMITAPLLSLLVIPAVYLLIHCSRIQPHAAPG